MSTASTYWSPLVKLLDPYVPGEQPKADNLVKLNTNENPYGPSPAVYQAIQQQMDAGLRLYPDPNGDELKEAIAEYYALSTDQVFVGNGSDEVLAHVFQGLLKHPLLFPDLTYSFYPVYCRLFQIPYRCIPLDDRYTIQVDDYFCENGGIIFANPNAPTGIYLELSEVERLLQANRDSVVVLDEAYIDFGCESSVSLTRKYENLLVVQTLSKSRSLAGLRVGFAVGNPNLIEALNRVKNSFNSYPVDRLAIAGGAAAMRDKDHVKKTAEKIIATRTWLAEALVQRSFIVLPSMTNFLMAKPQTMSAAELTAKLREHGILIRHFKQPRVEDFVRITIGTDDECTYLLEIIDKIT